MLLDGEEFYICAFWDLSTERFVSGGSIGRIPWSRAMRYACFHGLDETMLAPFWRVITVMDNGYHGWMKTEYDRYARMHKRSGKQETEKSSAAPRRRR